MLLMIFLKRNMISKAIKIHPNDNLIVAINDLKKGENVTVDNQTITIQELSLIHI